jgi:hypothetical protein
MLHTLKKSYLHNLQRVFPFPYLKFNLFGENLDETIMI